MPEVQEENTHPAGVRTKAVSDKPLSGGAMRNPMPRHGDRSKSDEKASEARVYDFAP